MCEHDGGVDKSVLELMPSLWNNVMRNWEDMDNWSWKFSFDLGNWKQETNNEENK